MSLFERIQKKIIIESSSDTTGQNKGNRNKKKKFSSSISRTVNANQQQEIPIDFSKTGKEDPVKGVKSPRDIIGNKKKQGRPFGSTNKPKETSPYQQQELPFDDGNEKSVKKRAPRKGVDYFFDPDKAKADREKLISKRKEYGIDRKGNMSDAGAERYARKTKQLSSGSNIPVKITQADKDLARRRAVGGDKITDKSGKVIGTTTGKYGGNLPRKRPSNAKSLEQIKKEIDSRPPDGRTTRTKVKTPSYKRIETKVTDKEIQDLIKRGQKATPKKTKNITFGARDKAIKDIDDLLIGEKPGEKAFTKKALRKQQRVVTKKITTPSKKEIEQSQKILDKVQTKSKGFKPKIDKSLLNAPIEDPWFTSDYPDASNVSTSKPKSKKFNGKSFDDFIKDAKKKNKAISQDIAKLKTKSFVPPKTTPLVTPPLKTPPKTIPLTQPLKEPKKIKKILSTKTPAYNPYKSTTKLGKVMSALRKNKKTAALAAAIGTGVYLYNRGKNNPKGIVPPPTPKSKIKSAKGVDIKFTLGGGDPSKGYKYAGRKDINK